MPETPDAEHGDEVRRARSCDLDRLIGRHAGAAQRRRIERVDALGHRDHVAGVGRGVLAEGSVERVAHVLLLEAQRLAAGDAVVAGATGVAEPWHRHALAERHLGDAGAELAHDADALVAGNEGRCGLDRPVAVGGVDVGVAEPRCLHLHPDLPRLEWRARDILDGEWEVKRADDRGPVLAGR